MSDPDSTPETSEGDLAPEDAALIEAARDALRLRFRDDWHHVAAAVRTGSGAVYSAVNLDANVGRVAVCAESVALGMARTAEPAQRIEAVAAVYGSSSDGPTAVVSPCGACRELLGEIAPNATILVPIGGGKIERWSVGDLLPGRLATDG